MDELTKRIANLVAAYVEHVWPHTERSGSKSETPMPKAKGSSNPPFAEYAHRMLDSNIVASGHFYWALERTWETSAKGKKEGVPHRFIVRALREDPAALQHWRDRTPTLARAFWETCVHVAKGVMLIHGQSAPEKKELERRLALDYDDPEALVVRRHPQDEEELRGRTRNGQKIDTMHTRRLMVEQLEQVEASTGYTGLEAMEILSERKAREGKDWSVRKLRSAREAVNREREGEVA